MRLHRDYSFDAACEDVYALLTDEAFQAEMSALVGESQGATGALQAAQAGNQLLALQSQQLSDLIALISANGRSGASHGMLAALGGLALWPEGLGEDRPLADSLPRIGYPDNPAALSAFRLRFRPWATGPETEDDRRAAAALAYSLANRAESLAASASSP